LRGQKATSPIGGHAVFEASSTDNPSAPAVTLTKTDGTSFLLHYYIHGDVNLGAWNAAPAGYTKRYATTGTGNYAYCIDSKNDTTSDGRLARVTTDFQFQLPFRDNRNSRQKKEHNMIELAVAAVVVAVLAGCNTGKPQPTTVVKTLNSDGTETCVIQDPNGDHSRDQKLAHCFPDGVMPGWVTNTVTATPTP
jgi:hypothetical protein